MPFPNFCTTSGERGSRSKAISVHSKRLKLIALFALSWLLKSYDFCADVDPRFAIASLVEMVQYLELAGPILFASTNLKPDESAAFATHTADLFLRGLLAPP